MNLTKLHEFDEILPLLVYFFFLFSIFFFLSFFLFFSLFFDFFLFFLFHPFLCMGEKVVAWCWGWLGVEGLGYVMVQRHAHELSGVWLWWYNARLHKVVQRHVAWKELGRGHFRAWRMAHAGSLIARSSYAWGIGCGRPASSCGNMAVVRPYRRSWKQAWCRIAMELLPAGASSVLRHQARSGTSRGCGQVLE